METGPASAMPERRTLKDPGGARPVFLNPLKVHLPVTATVSLAHRISGLILVLALPFLVLALAASLDAEAGGGGWLPLLKSIGGRICLLVFVWSLAHHTAAGVRHLLFDAGIGTSYPRARSSAWTVHAAAAIAVLAAAAALAFGARA